MSAGPEIGLLYLIWDTGRSTPFMTRSRNPPEQKEIRRTMQGTTNDETLVEAESEGENALPLPNPTIKKLGPRRPVHSRFPNVLFAIPASEDSDSLSRL